MPRNHLTPSLQSLFFALLLTATTDAQEAIYSTALSTGDPIQVPGVEEEWSVKTISRIEWSGNYLGIFSRETSSRSFLSFSLPGSDGSELSAGTGWPFSEFQADPGTTNREGNPPESPFITSAFGVNAYDGGFILQSSVDDNATALPESWPATFSAAYETGLTHWYHGYANPLVVAPNGDAVYVEKIDLEEKWGWLHSDGTIEILVDENTPIPSELSGAFKVFWGGPVSGATSIAKVLQDRTTIHFTSYNTSESPGSGNVIYSTSPEGAITVIQDSNGEIPTYEKLPAGADSFSIGDVSVNDVGTILYYAGIGKQGEFNRKTYWSTFKDGSVHFLELSTFVEYSQFEGSSVTFDNIASARVDDAGFILFEARVDGESKNSVWRKTGPSQVTRVSPPPETTIPGFSDYIVRSASIAAMNSFGRAVVVLEGFGNNEFRHFYFLEREDLSLLHLVTDGETISGIEKPVEVEEIAIGDDAQIGLLLSSREGYATDYHVVTAIDPRDQKPTGNFYQWDGGAGTSDWHSVVNGRSNWVDRFGVPWDVPPNSENADVEINADAQVVLSGDLTRVIQINLLKGNLELDTNLVCGYQMYVAEDASFTLKGFSVESPSLRSEGLIIMDSPGRTFTLLADELRVIDSDLVLKDGTLRIWNEKTVLENGTLRIEGGIVDSLGEITFRGSEPRFEVASGVDLELTAPNFVFEGDTTLSCESGASLDIGDPDTEATLNFSYKTGFPEEFRILTLAGEGVITLYDPIPIPSQAIVRNKSGLNNQSGLIIDTYEGDNLAEINVQGLFENTGAVTVKSGGFEGNFRNLAWLEATPRQSGHLPITLDGENRGTISINDRGLAYYDLTFESGSKLILKGAVLRSIFPGSELSETKLVFEKGSSIETVSGNWIIKFPSNEKANLAANLSIRDGASVDIEKANTEDAARLTNDSTGTLGLKGLIFNQLSIESNGRVDLSGDIKGVDDFEHRTLNIAARAFSLKDAQCIGSSDEATSVDFTFGAARTVAGEGTTHQGTFENVAFQDNASVIFDESALVVTAGNLSISNDVTVLGKLILGSNVSEVPFDSYTLIYLGDQFTKGHLEISSSPDEPLSSDPIIEFTNNDSTLTVSSNTAVTLRARGKHTTKPAGYLDFGNWIIEDGASCLLKHNPEIHTIGMRAKIQIGAPHPTLGSLSNLPVSNQTFVNQGTLILRDTELDMKGNTFEQQGTFDGKVIGNVQSIRNDVQGVIQLAGNIDIQGNLTMDTTLSLGASPGTGYISGDLTLLEGSEMIVEIGGKDPGTEFDFLEVGGTTTLAGTLKLSLIDNYLPDIDDTFYFLKSGSIADSFSNIDQTEAGRQRRFDLSEAPEGLLLTVSEISITSYEDWRNHFFSASDAANDLISGPSADPDLDGLTNLSEYLHATLPQQANALPFSFGFDDESKLVSTVQWAQSTPDFDWELLTSPNLKDWQPIPFTTELIEQIGDKKRLKITADVTPSGSKTFYRLAASAVEN